jgi:GTP-binding protein EngB required for normal cell division
VRRLEQPQSAAPAKEATLEAIGELLELSRSVMRASARHPLEEAEARLREGRLNLVLLGEFKRGKSTLANALLGKALLPAGVVPLTSAVTILRYGPAERLLVRFRDGREEEHPVGRLAEFATESGNPANQRAVELTVVEAPSDLLGAGLQVVDTPGIGSVFGHNTETAREFLPQVDAALFVLTADQPLSHAERELIREALERIPRVFFAVNKVDHLAPGDRETAIGFIRGRLAPIFNGSQPDLFPVSAREGTGVDELRARLLEFARGERDESLVQSVRALGRSFAADLAEAARFEAHAIELPLQELERRAAVFEERISALAAARKEAAVLLEEDVRRTLRERVDEPLLRYATDHSDELKHELDRFVADRPGLSPRRLAAELEAFVAETVRARFERVVVDCEEAIASELEGLERRHAEGVERIIDEVGEIAADVFGAGFGVHRPEVGLRAPSRFTFKLRDEQQMIEHLAAAGRTVLPGRVGRQLVRRDSEQRLLGLVDRHAGRLRSDLSDRVRASVREHERQRSFLVDEAIEAIRAAVVRATRQQRAGELRSSGRRAELESIAGRAAELSAELAWRDATA